MILEDICRNIWVKCQDVCNLFSNISEKNKKDKKGRKEGRREGGGNIIDISDQCMFLY